METCKTYVPWLIFGAFLGRPEETFGTSVQLQPGLFRGHIVCLFTVIGGQLGYVFIIYFLIFIYIYIFLCIYVMYTSVVGGQLSNVLVLVTFLHVFVYVYTCVYLDVIQIFVTGCRKSTFVKHRKDLEKNRNSDKQ